MDKARPRGADCDLSGDADLHAAVVLLLLPLILPPPGEERIERGVITIDDCFCEDDVVETNVSSDSVDGPNSGLIDVVALRIRVRMEMLLSSVMVLLRLGVNMEAMLGGEKLYLMHLSLSLGRYSLQLFSSSSLGVTSSPLLYDDCTVAPHE